MKKLVIYYNTVYNYKYKQFCGTAEHVKEKQTLYFNRVK